MEDRIKGMMKETMERKVNNALMILDDFQKRGFLKGKHLKRAKKDVKQCLIAYIEKDATES